MKTLGADVVQHIYQIMNIDAEWCVRSRDGYRWWGHRLCQHVSADKPFDDCGVEITRLHIRTDLLKEFDGTEKQLAKLGPLMAQGSLSGLVRHPEDPRRLQLAASLFIHAQTAPWLKQVAALVAAIQAAEAHQLAQPWAKQLGAAPDYSNHPDSGRRSKPDGMLALIERMVAPDGEQPSLFCDEGMEDAVEMFQQWPCCLLATGDADSFTAEFPFGEMSSLLTASTAQAHPALGHGLLLRFTLPVDGADVLAALELNERELTSLTRAHFLGSWSFGPLGLSFVSFFPNSLALFSPGCVVTLAQYAGSRAKWVTEEVYQEPWVEREQKARPAMLDFFELLGEMMGEPITDVPKKKAKARGKAATDKPKRAPRKKKPQ